MTLTRALVEILLSPYPESLQSTQSILDVAYQGRGTAPLTESITVGDVGGFPVKTPVEGVHMSPLHNAEAAPIFDRFGDDRFADNILRALEGLPQNGDDEEERDAAEEGALIEASGYPDPGSDPRFA